MSKKVSSKDKKFTYTPTSELPPLGKIQTDWNLKDHYYESENDQQIEKDALFYEQKMRSFIKKYKKTDFTSTTKKLLSALRDYEQLEEVSEGTKVMLYFDLRTQLNVNDTAAKKKLMKYDERFRKLSNEIIFFSLTLGRIPTDLQKKYLKDKELEKYHYLLKQTFENAKHNLTESEERILSLRSNTSRGMWADAVSKIKGNTQIKFKGKTIPLNEALDKHDSYKGKDRTDLWKIIMQSLEQIADVSEHELTAIVNHDKVSNELRGYKNSYTSSVLSYENNEKAVEALVEAISTKGFSLSKKFYKLKAELHGTKTIPYANRSESIGDLPKPTFEQAVTICRDVFYGIDQAYGSIFDRMLENGHIDAFSKKGKRGSAFMIGAHGVPTYVFLNHKNTFQWLETIAHEVGHAIHGELSKAQPAIYEDFTLTTAETASTLFEQLVTRKLIETLPDSQKIPALHESISRSVATIQRQIACFNFMKEMYEHIDNHGLATKQELALMMQKHLQSYVGPSVEVTELDGYSYVYWGHIRRGFYVYTYAYGLLVSNLMIQKYKEDPTYINKINQFLHAGGSDTVENIFGSIGINTRKVETFLESLKTQEEEIKQLEKLTRKKK